MSLDPTFIPRAHDVAPVGEREGIGPDVIRAGHVDSTAAVVERARESLLAALGKAYSIVVLASLSLVVAAFARNFSANAVPYAVAASASFLAAVVLTIVHEMRRSAKSAFHIEVGSATIVSIVAGFVMLAMVVEEFARTDPLTARVTFLLLGSIALVGFGTLVLGMHESVDRIRENAPATWARLGRSLSVAPWVAAMGCMVLAGSLVLSALSVTYPHEATAIAFFAFLGPLLYLRRVARGSSRPA